MARKVVKRKPIVRRVSARPLSFWHFIRKNLLIISGLLLLPVTVGAVISSYNYANLGSAAGRRNVLRTQDHPVDRCTGSIAAKDKCTVEGEKVCQTAAAGAVQGIEAGDRTGYLCECRYNSTDNCQYYCDTLDTVRCPVLPTKEPQRDCSPGDQEVGNCGNASDGSEAKCRVCQNDGKWSTSWDLDCPDDARVLGTKCAFTDVTPGIPPKEPTPTTPDTVSDSERAGCQVLDTDQGPYCWCAKGGGWQHQGAGLKRGDPVDSTFRTNCEAATLSGGGTFDFRKALQNFFGFFGF